MACRRARRPVRCSSRPRRRRAAGCGRAALGLPVVWAMVCLVASRSASTSCRTCRGRSSRTTSCGPAGPAGHTGQTLLELTGRCTTTTTTCARRTPRRRRGGPGRSTSSRSGSTRSASPSGTAGVDLRRRQPGHLLAGDPGHGLRRLAGVPAAKPALALIADRRSPASGCRGRASTGRRSSTTTTRPAVRDPGPRLLPGGAVARAVAPDLAAGPARGRGSAIVGPAVLWLFRRPLCAIVGVRCVNPGSQACPASSPTRVTLRRALARGRRRRGRARSCGPPVHADRRREDGRRRPRTRLGRGTLIRLALSRGRDRFAVVPRLLPETPLFT